MIRIAVYGKGGIGKSTTVSNVAAALAEMGLKVMQIGCDPKADSTILLRHGEAVPAVLDLYNEKKQALQLEDMIRIGYNGVICVEADGPKETVFYEEDALAAAKLEQPHTAALCRKLGYEGAFMTVNDIKDRTV